MNLASDHDNSAQSAKMATNARRCPECGGKVDENGKCEDCGEQVENTRQQARQGPVMNKTRQWLQQLAANCSCTRTKQELLSVLTANMPAGGAFQGAKDAGYSPSQSAAMAGQEAGS